MVDQEQKVVADDATPSYISELFSVTKADGSTTIGTQQGEYITVPSAGLNQADWIGRITKAFDERCIQETLNEYCTKLGVMDDQIVPGEHSDYEEFNYARYDSVDSVWKCYQNILTGDAVEARSATCVDNDGNVGGPQGTDLCQAPNTGAAEPEPACEDIIDVTMREIIRHHVEYGCKRMDKIEFTAPKEVLIRCQEGCEPQYRYTRPSKCNLCEETGMTKEPQCNYYFDPADNAAKEELYANVSLVLNIVLSSANFESFIYIELN